MYEARAPHARTSIASLTRMPDAPVPCAVQAFASIAPCTVTGRPHASIMIMQATPRDRAPRPRVYVLNPTLLSYPQLSCMAGPRAPCMRFDHTPIDIVFDSRALNALCTSAAMQAPRPCMTHGEL
jgi:hypothetical protein